VLELDEGKAPGSWRRFVADDFTDRRRWSAIVVCPGCSAPLSIYHHTISGDGVVTPSIAHPQVILERYGPCGWHPGAVKLRGWAPVPDLPLLPKKETCARCGRETYQLAGWGTWGNPGIICPRCRSELSRP
jgi:hypothetical protein